MTKPCRCAKWFLSDGLSQATVPKQLFCAESSCYHTRSRNTNHPVRLPPFCPHRLVSLVAPYQLQGTRLRRLRAVHRMSRHGMENAGVPRAVEPLGPLNTKGNPLASGTPPEVNHFGCPITAVPVTGSLRWGSKRLHLPAAQHIVFRPGEWVLSSTSA